MLAGKLSRRGLTEIHDKGGNLQALQAKQKSFRQRLGPQKASPVAQLTVRSERLRP
jgi:hypothetical protein